MPGFRFYRLPFVQSLVLHGFVFLLLLLSFKNQSTVLKPQPELEIVQAMVLDDAKIQAEVDKLRLKEEQKRLAEDNRQRLLEKRRKEEQKRLVEIKTKRQQEERLARAEEKKRQAIKKKQAQRLAELKKQQKEEMKRLAEIKRQKEETEKKRLAEEKKQKEAKDKRVKEEKRLAELAQKRKAAAERRKQEEISRKQRAKELDVKKQRDAKRKAAALAQYKKGIEKAKVLIRQKIERNWIRPLSAVKDLSCKIQVKVIPGGEVVYARVIKSSGNSPFDRSAERAVLKATPLPVPTKPELFSEFRTFEFNFNPR